MRFIEKRFNQPSLIRETSRLNYRTFYKYPLKISESLFNLNT